MLLDTLQEHQELLARERLESEKNKKMMMMLKRVSISRVPSWSPANVVLSIYLHTGISSKMSDNTTS